MISSAFRCSFLYFVAGMILASSSTDAEGISCYEGLGVIGQGVQARNSTANKCSEDVEHTCLSAAVYVQVFGLLFDVEVGACLEVDNIPLLSCEYLLQRFNESGYVPRGLDVSALDISNCTLDVCNTTLCNGIHAPSPTQAPSSTPSRGLWVMASFPTLLLGIVLYLLLNLTQ
uniref:uncharacterized protein LOC120342067 n=1 Tax=Styela clava TaxID=7725 RepID=UPI001939764B|nr:uncharacterized protein LOC120342067 [Styela clava]